VIIVGQEISLRSQIPHILNTESGCLTDSCIIQAIEQLPRDRAWRPSAVKLLFKELVRELVYSKP
jgi:hypothetical protein